MPDNNQETSGPYTQGTLFEENYLKRTHKTLTSNPEIALTELVANAWDAGATQVDITIPSEDGGMLVVKDNGTGLTFDEFQKRWRKLSYNRLSHQDKKVEFPPGVPGNRLAFGRNGIGRHGLLCFNDEYTIVSDKKGLRHTFEINSTAKDPINIKSYKEDRIDSSEHGLSLQTIVREHRPDPDRILEVLSSRFISDPAFFVFVNGKKVEEQDLAGLRGRSGPISVTDSITIEILFIDTTASHRRNTYQGIAFWQSKRLVGEPSWFLNKEPVMDGRTTNAKKFIFIVQSDDLEDFVKEDWTGFRDCTEMDLVYAKVKEYVLESLRKYNQEHVAEIKADIYKNLKSQYGEMSALGRYEVEETIERISQTKPTASKESIEIAVEAVANVAQARSGESLLRKLSSLDEDEVDALDELLSKWSVKDALLVLDEIDRRISTIEAIRRFSERPDTKEVQVLEPLITKARWIFGPEYESLEYCANAQLRTIAKKVFKATDASFINDKKRPDLFVVSGSVFSLTGISEIDESGLSRLSRILIVEIKKGAFKITRTERDQAEHYVEDILGSGLLTASVVINAFVVGASVDSKVSAKTSVQEGLGTIWTTFYSQLVDTANKRLFNLRKMLQSRYDEMTDERVKSKAVQDTLPGI